MARPLGEYTLEDWRRLRPLTHRLKSLRYRRITEAYVRLPPRAGDVVGIIRQGRNRRVLVTIAFDDPEAIAWQTKLVALYVPDPLHVIADNSRGDGAAGEIARIAAAAGVPCLRLPPIDWRRGVSSRSHGLALNWVWRNLIRPGAPVAFGFLDDDIFPTGPDDPFAPLSRQDFYGVVREAGERWFLWAGFCFFRFDRVRDLALDFGQDWFIGLDTGGGNWDVLYRHVQRGALAEAQTAFVPYKVGVSSADGPLQTVGPWLHEVGMARTPEIAADKRRVVAALLAPHLETSGEPAAPQTGARAGRPS